jgi:hypothetical protein
MDGASKLSPATLMLPGLFKDMQLNQWHTYTHNTSPTLPAASLASRAGPAQPPHLLTSAAVVKAAALC